jgi:hypothetical protein
MRVPFVAILALALSAVAIAGRPKKKPTAADPPAASTSQFASDASTIVTLSITITPQATEDGITIDEGERLQTVEDWIQMLDVEFAMRYQDNQTPYVIFSRERGEVRNNPHAQGHYDLRTTAMTADQKKQLQAREHTWLRGKLEAVTKRKFRLVVKLVYKDRVYCYGYDLKDWGQAHFMHFSHGFSAEELQDCLNVYRQKAGQSTYTSTKMNKAPNAESRQLSFAVGNLFILAAWFVAQHKLSKLGPSLTLAIIVTYALETGSYRIDEALVTGKNGGNSLDPARAQAMFDLGQANTSNPQMIHPLIETVLYGGPQESSAEREESCLKQGLPTPAQLIQYYNLAAAKELGSSLEPGAQDKKKHSGTFIATDFLSTAKSQEATEIMVASGLTGKSLFTTHLSIVSPSCG